MYVDYQRVEPGHDEIHKRLMNWESWVKVRLHATSHPMWKQARSNAWQWHTPEHRDSCDLLDAQLIEKAVSHLPEQHRHAVRWGYVHRTHPNAACRVLGVGHNMLYKLLRDGRQMLINTLHK